MYLYIELLRAKDSWLQLSPEERKGKIDRLLADPKQHPIAGVVPMSFQQVGNVFLLEGVNDQPVVIDSAAARPTRFRYVAAWLIPTLELLRIFEKRVDNLGYFFDHFEQENLWGAMDVAATVGDLINPGQEQPSISLPDGPGRLARTEREIQMLRRDLDDLRKNLNPANSARSAQK